MCMCSHVHVLGYRTRVIHMRVKLCGPERLNTCHQVLGTAWSLGFQSHESLIIVRTCHQLQPVQVLGLTTCHGTPLTTTKKHLGLPAVLCELEAGQYIVATRVHTEAMFARAATLACLLATKFRLRASAVKAAVTGIVELARGRRHVVVGVDADGSRHLFFRATGPRQPGGIQCGEVDAARYVPAALLEPAAALSLLRVRVGDHPALPEYPGILEPRARPLR